MKITSIFIAFVFFVCAGPFQISNAQPVLTPDAAKSFIDFYFNGQGQGAVLADLQICTEIVENECSDPVSPLALEMGVRYNAWMMFVVPQGDEIDDIIVQFNHAGITRVTRELSIKGSIRYRTWRAFTPNRAGNWEIVVLQDAGTEVRTIKTTTVTVNE